MAASPVLCDTGAAKFMNTRLRRVLLGLPFAIALAVILWMAHSTMVLRQEPVYQGKPLSYWVTRVGEIEEFNGAPEDAVAAIRSIGPKAVPFLLKWMPQRKPQRPALLQRFMEWFSGWFSHPEVK